MGTTKEGALLLQMGTTKEGALLLETGLTEGPKRWELLSKSLFLSLKGSFLSISGENASKHQRSLV